MNKVKIRKNAFNAWLRKQKERNDRVGDLAKDAIQDIREFKHKCSDYDETFPTSNKSKDYIDYLMMRGACENAMKSFIVAWEEFCGEKVRLWYER